MDSLRCLFSHLLQNFSADTLYVFLTDAGLSIVILDILQCRSEVCVYILVYDGVYLVIDSILYHLS